MAYLKRKVARTALLFLLAVALLAAVPRASSDLERGIFRYLDGVVTLHESLPDYALGSFEPSLRWPYAPPRAIATPILLKDRSDLLISAHRLIESENGIQSAIKRLLLCVSDGFGGFVAITDLNGEKDGESIGHDSGDLDGNGVPDVVTLFANADGTPVLRVMMNPSTRDSEAEFVYSNTLDTGDVFSPRAVRTGDVNGDGLDDIVLICQASWGEVAIATFISGGIGSVRTSEWSYPEVMFPLAGSWIELTDIDQDGYCDAILIGVSMESLKGGEAAMALDVGWGSPSGQLLFDYVPFPLDFTPQSIACADFDGDQQIEIVLSWRTEEDNAASLIGVTLDEPIFSSSAAVLSIDRLTGDLRTQQVDLGIFGMVLKAADLDSDGIKDLVVFDHLGTVTIRLGGSTTFTEPATFFTCATSTYSPVWTAFIADFNGDNHLDLGVQYKSPGLCICFGDGKGRFGSTWFSPPTTTLLEDADCSIAKPAADFDRDGSVDIALWNSNKLITSYGTRHGSHRETVSEELPFDISFVGIGDFDGNKIPDRMIVTESEGFTFFVTYLTINRDLSAAHIDTLFQLEGRFHELVVGDLNNDGRDDLVVSLGIHGTHVLLSDSDGIQRLIGNLEVDADVYSVATLDLADFDEDGNLDLLGLVYRYDTGRVGMVAVWAGDGAGGFEQQFSTLPDLISGVGDFNGDGHIDFQVFYKSRYPIVYYGDGKFGFESADSTMAGSPVGDLNGDSYCDSIAHLFGSVKVELGVSGISGATSYFASGGVEFTQAWQRESDFVIGDFNGDQWLDIAALYGDRLCVLTNEFFNIKEDWPW